MFAIVIVSLVLVSIGANPVDWRVIGGSEAKDGQFPHMISLRFQLSATEEMHMCGGSIINSRWTVTAAHCVYGYNAKLFFIKAGTTNLYTTGFVYQIEQIIIHEDYDLVAISNDVSVIKVTKDIEFIPDRVVPIPLNEESFFGGEEVTFAGWGSTELWGPPPDKLQFMTAKIVPLETCRKEQYPFEVTDGMICTAAGKGKGACHGDSGSSLIGDGKLVGIVSWGRPCAIGYPDVFTKISYYLDWIVTQTNK